MTLVSCSEHDEACAVSAGKSPRVPIGETRQVVLRVNFGRWSALDFSGATWLSGAPAPDGMADGATVSAMATEVTESRPAYESDQTVVVHHVDVVLEDGSKLYFGTSFCL
jgi:hypothetical protein